MENDLHRYAQFPPGAHACGRCKAGYVATGMSFFDDATCRQLALYEVGEMPASDAA